MFSTPVAICGGNYFTGWGDGACYDSGAYKREGVWLIEWVLKKLLSWVPDGVNVVGSTSHSPKLSSYT